MKINKLYICLVMMLFNTMVYSNEFDEFGSGPWSLPPVSEFGPNGEIIGPHGTEPFGFSGAQQRMINDAINSVHATPQTTYSFNYVKEKYTEVANLSPSDKNRYVPSPNDYIVPWRIDPTTGEQWYTLYRNFVPGYFNLVATTTMVNGAKSSIGYNFESTHVSGGTDFSNMNAYGGINFGGIDMGYTTTTSPPVIFTPVTTTNLMDKAILNGSQLRTLMDNLKNGPYTMREAPYVYIDSNDKTRMGYLTIISNTTNGETLRYFFDTVANYDNHIKLPIANGIELQPCGGVNSGCSYNAGGIVSVTTWDGTNNQPELSLPNWHLVIHKASGLQLIVVPLERPASNQNVQPEKAYYNAIPRIYRPNFVPGSDRDTAELLYENNDSLSLEQALFIKREYFDVQVPDLKGAIDVYMQNLITKVSNGLSDEFKDSAEEILIRYATAELVKLNSNYLTPDTTDPKQKANFSNMTNVANVLNNKSWVLYNGNCNASAKEQNTKSLLPNTNPVGGGMQANTFIDKKRQLQSGITTPDIDMQKAIDVAIKNLKVGKPVMAGVMYERQYGADGLLGGNSSDNNNVATNHYITIVGMGIDNGNPYFSYYDNFVDGYSQNKTQRSLSTLELIGTDTNENRFYYYKDSVGNYFFRDKTAKTLDGPYDGVTYFGHGFGNQYILTEIRDNF